MAASNPEPSSVPAAEVVECDAIVGVFLVTPTSHGDSRGRFVETYRRSWVPDSREMVQANRSDKVAGSLVGLHYHLHQADYWYAVAGRAQVVLHDLREGSPTEGATFGFEIGDANEQGVYIPAGVAHGFAALTDVMVTYLVDQYYSPEDELGVAWDDPEVGAPWLVDDPVVSDRDRTNPRRADIAPGARPLIGPGPPPPSV
jgi:dTDP-4-dehydrorhamnose 3,5-epimerase